MYNVLKIRILRNFPCLLNTCKSSPTSMVYWTTSRIQLGLSWSWCMVSSKHDIAIPTSVNTNLHIKVKRSLKHSGRRGRNHCSWIYNVQRSIQSVLITSKVVSSNPALGKVCSIQHYVIKFVSDLWQVGEHVKPPNWSYWFKLYLIGIIVTIIKNL